MLPALENCSIGRLRLDIKREDLARVRATVEDVFAKRKVQQWTTRLKESTLQELVEQYDLLRWPTIQQLTEHDIMLVIFSEFFSEISNVLARRSGRTGEPILDQCSPLFAEL